MIFYCYCAYVEMCTKWKRRSCDNSGTATRNNTHEVVGGGEGEISVFSCGDSVDYARALTYPRRSSSNLHALSVALNISGSFLCEPVLLAVIMPVMPPDVPYQCLACQTMLMQ